MEEEKLLDGAWEEPGVIGTRIEIDDPTITVLWRNAPVLITKFKKKKIENGIELELRKKDLCYEKESSPYASLEKVVYQDEKLQIVEYFPITGESHTTLKKTNNSRYGNYEIVDEILEELEGIWSDKNQFYKLEFIKNECILNENKIKVHVLHSNSYPKERREYKIVDEDSSKWGIFHFHDLEYLNGNLVATEMIYDAGPQKIMFYKKK